MSYKTLLYLFIYRIIISLLTRNYEYPDEYWQGPEVAHRLHYGYGFLTWQWTIEEPLRNPIYPYLLSLAYYIVDLFHLQQIIQYASQLFIQVPLTMATDYFLLKILKYLYGNITIPMIILIFSNWYYASTLIRTYFNSFQTCLAVIAFYYWVTNSQLGENNYKDLMNRIFVTISYVSRPTSIMIWALLWPYELYKIIKIYGIFSYRSIRFIGKNIIIIACMIGLSFAVGTIFNNKPTLTQLNFIKYNFIEKWSQLYGREHILFYFGLTLPFMLHFGLIFLGLALILIIKGKFNKNNQKEQKRQANLKQLQTIACLSVVYLLISSLSTHKQHRFIFPIIPFLLILSAFCFKIQKISIFNLNFPQKLLQFLLFVITLVNIFFFVTFNYYGKSDGISVWKQIDNEMKIQNMKDNQTAIIVLGQSHFIPGISMLHRNVTYRIPDSSAIKMSTNSSQNLLLSQNPQELYTILTQQEQIEPNFIIAQGKYLKYTKQLLYNQGYRQIKSWRHCTILQQIFIQYDSIHLYQHNS